MPSDDIAISVRNLTKTYRLFGHPGDRIKQFFSFGLKQYHREFTALKDVSFDIKKGETVGIIGRNGSGKSTLLQLISGIVRPTAGIVKVDNRIAALLELGAGFNADFTGRENIYFQGAVMGFTKAEMDSRFDQIEAFADIGPFMDQLVRTYSSGMYIRLAFANMIHTDSDVLVIDEALAVGDEAFQRKCFDKLSDYLDNRNKVLLFVSHNVRQIERICSRALWLDSGRVVLDGEATEVCNAYLDNAHQLIQGARNDPGRHSTPHFPAELIVTNIALHNENGILADEVAMHAQVAVLIDLCAFVTLATPEIVIAFHTVDAIPVVAAMTAIPVQGVDLPPGEYRLECRIHDLPLMPGVYQLQVGVLDRFRRNIWTSHRGLALRILSPAGANPLRMPPGLVDMPYEWSFMSLDATTSRSSSASSCFSGRSRVATQGFGDSD